MVILASTMAVPAKWCDFPMTQHAPDSLTGGLECVAAAAVHLALLQRSDEPVAELLSRLPPENRSAIQARLAQHGGRGGLPLTDKHIRLAAYPVGLIVYRPGSQMVEQFRECLFPWIALVRDEAGHGARSNRYILVLDYLDAGRVVIADPHPRHPQLCVLRLGEFAASWYRAAPARRPPWAAVLWRHTARASIRV